jgi:hypothetical protein
MITGKQMLQAMEKAVAERGDGWTYPDTGNCVYFYEPEYYDHTPDEEGMISPMVVEFGNEAQPACLVGLALSYIDRSILVDISESGNNGEGISVLATEQSRVSMDRMAVTISAIAQSAQDGGAPWGDALIKAKEFYAHPTWDEE